MFSQFPNSQSTWIIHHSKLLAYVGLIRCPKSENIFLLKTFCRSRETVRAQCMITSEFHQNIYHRKVKILNVTIADKIFYDVDACGDEDILETKVDEIEEIKDKRTHHDIV